VLLPKLYLLRSKAPPEEVLRRVRALLEPWRLPGAAAAPARPLCAGQVDGLRFELRRRSAEAGPGPVRLLGEVAPDGSGSLLRLRFRVTRGALAGLLVMGLLLGGALAAIMRHRGSAATTPELLAVAAAGIGALVFTFRLGWEKARLVRLAGFLNGEVDARWLDAERAGAGPAS
jgi:hypothetical protein